MIVSIERYVMVGFPVQAKYLSTMRNATLKVIATFMAAVLLQSLSFAARKLYVIPCIDVNTWTTDYYYLYGVRKKLAQLYDAYVQAYSITTLVTPMVVMIFATLLINYHLFWSSRRFANSGVEQKRCVTRLSLSTTVCHLIFETPHVAVFVFAATAPTVDFWKKLEPLTAIANFLSLLNNSIPFFIYLSCSKRYRLIAKTVLLCAPPIDTNDIQTEAGHQRATLNVRLKAQTNSSITCDLKFLKKSSPPSYQTTLATTVSTKKRRSSYGERKLSSEDLCGPKNESSSLLP